MELKPGYKQTEAGPIPGDWDVKPLGSIVTAMELGGNYPNQDLETQFPLMKMGNVGRGSIELNKIEYVAPGITPDPVHRLRRGDVLFNTRNTLDLVGKVAIWRDDLLVAYYNSNLMRLDFDPEHVCSNEYAAYALNSAGAISRLRAMATGTTSVAAIYTRDLRQFLFVVPPRAAQCAIATALSDVDALIEALDSLVAKKRDLKQAAMQQLLTGRLRLSGFRERALTLKSSRTLVIPEDWRTAVVSQIAASTPNAIVGGPFGSELVSSDYVESGVPVIRGQNMIGRWVSGSFVFVSAAKAKALIANLARPGDLVFTQRGTLGQVSLVPEKPYERYVVSQSQMKLTLNRDVADPIFFYYVFSSAEQQELLRQNTIQTGVPHINLGILKRLPVQVPELAEQVAIATVLSDMDAEIAALEARREKTRALKQGMMQELLTGRMRLV